MSDKHNRACILPTVKRSIKYDLILTGFMASYLALLPPVSPEIRNQGLCMVPDLILAYLPEKLDYIRTVAKCDNPNIPNISAQEVSWPKDSVFRPGIVPVAPESMDKHQARITSCYLGCSTIE